MPNINMELRTYLYRLHSSQEIVAAGENMSKNHYAIDVGGARCHNVHRCEPGSVSDSTQMGSVG